MDIVKTRFSDSQIITVDEIKTQCRIDGTDEDDYLLTVAESVHEYLEKELNRALLSCGFSMVLNQWPEMGYRLPRPPLVSIDSIKYYDVDGTEFDYPVANITHGSISGIFGVKGSNSWPDTELRNFEPIVINFTAGYATVDEINPFIKQAALLIAGDYYENREESVIGQGVTIGEIPAGARRIIALHTYKRM